MPGGRTHSALTVATTVALLAGSAPQPMVLGCLLGLLFTPDLDQAQGKGPWRFIWRPYGHLLKHRSVWSHGPIIGTLGRILYISVLLAPIILIVRFYLTTIPNINIHAALLVLGGLMIADAIHWAADITSTYLKETWHGTRNKKGYYRARPQSRG